MEYALNSIKRCYNMKLDEIIIILFSNIYVELGKKNFVLLKQQHFCRDAVNGT